MIVQCPYCATRYQVDEARFNSPNPMLKCARCRHVFPAPGSKKPGASAKSRKIPPPEDESLTLPFDQTSWKDENDAPARAGDDDQDGFVLGTEDQADGAGAETEAESPVEIVIEDEPELAEGSVPDDEEAADDPLPDMSFGDEDDDDVVPAVATAASRERNAVRAVLMFLLLVLFGYAILTRALFSSPALADRLLGPLPLIGTLTRGSQLARDISLLEVRGVFQKLKSGKDVFVITGDAVSAAPVTLSSVEIRGQLLDAEGKVLAEKRIYCGNVVSAKILNNLTPREVSVLQKLAPPKQFAIKPGDSAGFVIVFTDPPSDAVELSAEVVEART